MGTGRKLALFAVGLMASSLAGTASAGAATFSNSTPIVINDASASTPYPSTIDVSGQSGTITKVTATIGLTHDAPADFDSLLVGPGGQKTILMSDTCSGSNLPNAVFVFDDSAATTVPDGCVSGTFKPTDTTPGDAFDAPAPAGPYGASLSVFNGVSPNGQWRLFVMDDTTAGGTGSTVNSWSLDLATAAAAAPPPAPQGKKKCKKAKKKSSAGAQAAKKKCKKKKS